MNDYVIYNTQNHILICRQHGYGIAPDYITRHFRECHKEIPLKTRNEISEYAKTLELWMSEDVITRHDGLFIEGLKVIAGYQCQYEGCHELRSSEISMKKHYHKVHRWVVAQGYKWKKQLMQTIFHGQHVKYVLFRLKLIIDISLLIRTMNIRMCNG